MNMTFSLWNPIKSKNFYYIDKMVAKYFTMGGLGILIHKYLGPQDNTPSEVKTTPNYKGKANETTIQDVLFGENRDRKYAKDLIELKGVYQPNESSAFILSQFGYFPDGDVVQIWFHLNMCVDQLGRKLMSGDVLELSNWRDTDLLDESSPAINRFYVVQDVTRGGLAPEWRPHLLQITATALVDSQEYRDILGDGSNPDDLRNMISNYNKVIEINDQVNEQAAAEVPYRNFSAPNLFVNINDATQDTISNLSDWYQNGDAIPPNSSTVATGGTSFPSDAAVDSYFLRTDYNPPRLFQKSSTGWTAIEDDFASEWSPTSRVLKTFIDNTNISVISSRPGDTIPEKVAISKVIKPKTDF